jgi:hypothetical protein
MAEHPSAAIVDCACLRRYMRTEVRLDTPETSLARCVCGEVLGAWNGVLRLEYEPEEDEDDDWN